MADLLQIVPVVASGLFAGTALGISVGEHPAREVMDAEHARVHFDESYARVSKSQASLAVVAGASSAWLAYIGGPNRKMHATAAVLMLGMLPWTMLIIFPVNDELRSKKKLSDTEIKKGLRSWGKLHMVRTVASVAAFGLATLSLAASCSGSEQEPRPIVSY